jgi:DNA-binding Xre family transcriptional regulator
MPNRRPDVKAEFQDKYGETRKIHTTRHGYKVLRENVTPALQLNRELAALIGSKIKAKRIAAHLSLESLCRRAGLVSQTPKSRMWEIENAKRQEGIRLGTLYAIAIALDCEASELLPTIEEAKSLGVKIEQEERLTV